MSLSHIKVIVLDIDGTLSNEVSWLKLTESLGADRSLHEEIFQQFKENKLSYPEAKAKLIALWQSTGKAHLSILQNLFSTWKLKADAEKTIQYLKSKYRVILISGSVDTYVEIIARKLNIETWFANTRLIWDQDNQLVDFEYHRDQAGKKVEQLETFLVKNAYTKDDCLVIGDGDSDIGLFRILPFSIAVANEEYPELQKIAWKTILNLEELIDIL